MTNVLVCVKRVPDATGEVVLTADGSRVDGRYGGYTMSAHEECAIEMKARLAFEFHSFHIVFIQLQRLGQMIIGLFVVSFLQKNFT